MNVGLFDPCLVPSALFDTVMAPRGLYDQVMVRCIESVTVIETAGGGEEELALERRRKNLKRARAKRQGAQVAQFLAAFTTTFED